MNPIQTLLTIIPLLATAAPGETRYFVDPVRGDDSHAGREQSQAWRSIAKVNSLQLTPGEEILNFFDGAGIGAKSTRNLAITGNRFSAATPAIQIQNSCFKVTIESNETGARQ